jgi:uncharacterized cupredoxin-like copper-binding protein
LAVAVVVLFAGPGVIASVACGEDEEDPSSSPTAVADPDPEAEPDPEADPDPEPEADPEAGPVDGVVRPKSDGATQIDVVLSEWAVAPAQTTVAAGTIYFLVENEGPEDAHEFVIARTSRSLDELPIVDGKVDESLVSVVDEIEPFNVGTSASIELDLEAGDYVLLCNIAEEEEGELESHVELGMKAAFTVE